MNPSCQPVLQPKQSWWQSLSIYRSSYWSPVWTRCPFLILLIMLSMEFQDQVLPIGEGTRFPLSLVAMEFNDWPNFHRLMIWSKVGYSFGCFTTRPSKYAKPYGGFTFFLPTILWVALLLSGKTGLTGTLSRCKIFLTLVFEIPVAFSISRNELPFSYNSATLWSQVFELEKVNSMKLCDFGHIAWWAAGVTK